MILRHVRHPWRLALLIGAGLVVAFAIALASVIPISSETARAAVAAVLADRLDGEVELQELSVQFLPRLRADGRGLTIRHKGRRDVPPLISIARFSAEGSLLNLSRRHITRLTVDELDIEIPPDRNREDDETAGEQARPAAHGGADERARSAGTERTFVVDEMIANDSRLVVIPNERGKDPRVWAIHRLRMRSLGVDRAMPFDATLTNAVPPGEIDTRGSFGPWRVGEPGRTPLDGRFQFDRADLGVFKGISGILSAHGTFGGVLERIDIHGETDTPQFTVAAGGHPVPLHASYHAIVDGTNGDTLLDPVNGSFLKTSLVAKGAIVRTPGQDGRTVTLDITMNQARLEDVLKLAVKAPKPPMTGDLRLKTKFVLPPGDEDVVRKLRLDGQFTIAGTRFTSPDVQTKIDELSHRSRGKTPEEGKERVASQFRGTFKLGNGALTIAEVAFDVPGALVRLTGTYALVPETLDFSGTLSMDAPISETTTGIKRRLLRIVDPIFAPKGGTGTEIPIRIKGDRRNPSFGIDKGRFFRRGSERARR